MKNKRGQGLSTNAIVLIILAVVVLAVLIVGFTMGWEKIAPWLSTNNVNSIKTQCASACATNDIYGFCTQIRELKADDLRAEDSKNTCKKFATETKYASYGIEDCQEMTCAA